MELGMPQWHGNESSRMTWLSSALKNAVGHLVYIFTGVVTSVSSLMLTTSWWLEIQHLKWLRSELEKTYELKVPIAGWKSGDSRELSSLGRTIRLTSSGIELEGYDKHVKGLIEEWNMQECRPVSTPYEKSKEGDDTREERLPLSPQDATFVPSGRCPDQLRRSRSP